MICWQMDDVSCLIDLVVSCCCCFFFGVQIGEECGVFGWGFGVFGKRSWFLWEICDEEDEQEDCEVVDDGGECYLEVFWSGRIIIYGV